MSRLSAWPPRASSHTSMPAAGACMSPVPENPAAVSEERAHTGLGHVIGTRQTDDSPADHYDVVCVLAHTRVYPWRSMERRVVAQIHLAEPVHREGGGEVPSRWRDPTHTP
jgi:hypothetical protein